MSRHQRGPHHQEGADRARQGDRATGETVRPLIESRAQQLSVRLPRSPVWGVRRRRAPCRRCSPTCSTTPPSTPRGRPHRDQPPARARRGVVEVKDDGEGIDAQLLPACSIFSCRAQRSLDRARAAGAWGSRWSSGWWSAPGPRRAERLSGARHGVRITCRASPQLATARKKSSHLRSAGRAPRAARAGGGHKRRCCGTVAAYLAKATYQGGHRGSRGARLGARVRAAGGRARHRVARAGR